jgi:hypothetical protein
VGFSRNQNFKSVLLCSCSAVDLYSIGTRFESQPGLYCLTLYCMCVCELPAGMSGDVDTIYVSGNFDVVWIQHIV